MSASRVMSIAALALLGLVSGSAIVRGQTAGSADAKAPVPATANTSVEEKRGYWWKKEPPPTEGEAQAHAELGPPPNEEALLAMHPRDVAKMLEEYRDYAMWRMTPTTVKWYYDLQDFARRRARAFMNTTELVMLENPAINMQTVYPTNPTGQEARVAQRTQSIQSRLVQEGERAALILLSKADCTYCTEQRAILKHFQTKYQWDTREIDIGENPAAAQQFGTSFTPTTVVIFRNSKHWAPVAVGVETLEKLEEGIYRAVRYAYGETEADQYTLQEFNDGGIYDPKRKRP